MTDNKKEHHCPICKGEVSKEAKDHVFTELDKLSKDHTYKPKTYKGDNEQK